MSFDAMTDYAMNHGSVLEHEAARALLEQTLKIFAGALTAAEARRLAAELPSPASDWIASADHGETFGPDEVYARVRDRLGLEMGVAREHAQVAVAAMVRELSPETRQWIEQRLGGSWIALLQVPPRSHAPSRRRREHPHAEAERPHTLAEGRAGSSAPLSESAPSRTQPDSVAEDNPYGDRKLSSGHQVHSEPIASSIPRSRHSSSEHESGG
jgi:uncharacterized protein (DUF2267 family)